MENKDIVISVLLGLIFLFLIVSSVGLKPYTLDFVTSIGNTTNNTIGVGSIVINGDKLIRPVLAENSSGLVFQNVAPLEEGGFPFIFISQKDNNETVVSSWNQIGKNNSFSGSMNSFGLVPSDYINFGVTEPTTNDTQGIQFLLNKSSYLTYCDWLQDNMSLIPEGCKYYADTGGRGVPLGFFGDLEVHRTATIHEGLLAYNNFDFVGRDGNDVNFLFNGEYENGKHHIRDIRQILANITDFERVICDFDDTTLCTFVSESIAPEVGRDWASVNEVECHEDSCANAKGGNLKTMCVSDGTQGAKDINISFWATTNLQGGDSLIVNLDDNDGNSTDILSITGNVIDQFYEFTMPLIYENKSNITTCFTLDGSNVVREAWVDIVKVTATFDPSIEINNTYQGGRTIWGDDRGSLSCGVEVKQQVNNLTFEPEWVMEVGCPDGVTKLLGDATFIDTTVENQTIIGDSLITGDLSVEGEIYLKDVSINSTGLIGLECSDGQVLEYEISTGLWECGTDSTGTDDQTLAEVLAQGNDGSGYNATVDCITLQDGQSYCTLGTTYYNATSLGLVAGTSTGTIADINEYGGVSYNVTETAGVPGLDLRVNFTGVEDFNQLIIRYKSDPSETHTMRVQIWNYDDSTWENYLTFTNIIAYELKNVGVYDSEEHLSNGTVQLRFYSASNGNVNHEHYFSWITISDGFATPSGAEVDPFSYHKTENINATGYNVTADTITSYGYDVASYELTQEGSNSTLKWIRN